MTLTDTISISFSMTIICAFHALWVMFGIATLKFFWDAGKDFIPFRGIGLMFWLVMMVVTYILWWMFYCAFRFITGL